MSLKINPISANIQPIQAAQQKNYEPVNRVERIATAYENSEYSPNHPNMKNDYRANKLDFLA